MKDLILSIVLIILSKSIYAQINSNKIKLYENVQDSVLGTDIILKNNEIVFQKT